MFQSYFKICIKIKKSSLQINIMHNTQLFGMISFDATDYRIPYVVLVNYWLAC